MAIQSENVKLILRLGAKSILKLLVSRLYSVNGYYLLKKTIDSPAPGAEHRVATYCYKAGDADVDELVHRLDPLDNESRKDLVSRILFYRSGFRNCYITRTKDNDICCIQWIIYPSENNVISSRYGNVFQNLNSNEVIVENVFVFPRYRGRGLAVQSTSELLGIAGREGYRVAIAYIRVDRISALSEFVKMNFRITRYLKERKLLGTVKRS